MIQIPMPGEKLGETIVIASCWLNDDATPTMPLSATLLLLATRVPYYRVTEAERTGGQWRLRSSISEFRNIIPATEEYSDRIGGY